MGICPMFLSPLSLGSLASQTVSDTQPCSKHVVTVFVPTLVSVCEMPSWNNLSEQMKICNCDCKFCLLPCPSASVIKNSDISIYTHFVLFETVSVFIFCRFYTAVPAHGLFCLFFFLLLSVSRHRSSALTAQPPLTLLFVVKSKLNLDPLVINTQPWYIYTAVLNIAVLIQVLYQI